jgi:hypothetical protein
VPRTREQSKSLLLRLPVNAKQAVAVQMDVAAEELDFWLQEQPRRLQLAEPPHGRLALAPPASQGPRRSVTPAQASDTEPLRKGLVP